MDVMIDPSLLIASNTIEATMKQIDSVQKQVSDKITLYYPKSLFNLLENEEDIHDDNWRFFLSNAEPATRDLIETLKQSIITLDVFGVDEIIPKEHQSFAEALKEEMLYRDGDAELAHKILMEEWIFLHEHSWVVSRTRKSFNRMTHAGAICLLYGERTVDSVVRRTLHRQDAQLLSSFDRLRAFGKWIAVGGASATNLLGPLGGILTGFALGGVLLIDPD